MKFKAILRKYVINNISYKIMAFIFAFIVWLVVLNLTDPDYTRTISNIKVQVINEQAVLDGTHVYTVSSGETTSINVTGKRSIISTLSANDFLVTADFAQLSITNAAPIFVELVGDKMRYSGQLTIVPKDINMLINIEDMTSREIPVVLEYKGELSDGIVIEEANISPKKVTINAPESITNSAEKVVVTANYGNINSDTTMFLQPVIKNVNGNVIKQEGDTSIDDNQISVEFKVSYKKDVPIRVFTTGAPHEGYKVESVSLSQDTIAVKGTKNAIYSLFRISIPGEVVNVSGATRSFTIEIDVTPYLPEGTAVYGESPTVSVTVNIVKEESEEVETTTEKVNENKLPDSLEITGVVVNEETEMEKEQ